MTNALYNWQSRVNPADFLLEGNGELEVTADNELLIRTFHVGAYRKATNVWLKDVVLPRHFRLSFRYKSNSAAGNTMVLFHALPLKLGSLFEDRRPDAQYCDLASWRKMVAYTVGFHRGPYNNPSVLRKIGGHVPEHYGMVPWPSDAWQEMDTITRFNTAKEPIGPADKNKLHEFRLERTDRIRFFVNDTLIHDQSDTSQYPYHTENLSGGHLGFRNFGGPADDLYPQILLEAM